MNLTKLTIKNFKCFENLEVPLNSKLTVIVGENSSGKTTILEAAATAVGTLLYSLDGIAKYGIKKNDVHNKYYDLGSVVDVQPQYPVEIIAEGKVDNKEITWKRSLNGKNSNTTVIDAKEIIIISKDYQQRLRNGDSSLIMPIVAYYGTGRLWDYHRQKRNDTSQKSTRSNGYIDCLDGTSNIKLMLNWFKKMAWLEGQNEKNSPEFAAVREAMEKCFSLMTKINDVKVQFNPDTSEIDIIYRTNDSRVRIPLNQLSDGYKGTISLIADIAYRMAILNPQLSNSVLTKASGVVLIDEVDLHLHPAWQQRVLDDLIEIFPQVQFIVSTHAPAVINSVSSENLVILNNYKIACLNNQVYGKDVNSVLSEIMSVPSRPPRVAELFSDFYSKLNENKYDSAEQILDKIEELRNYHDNEVSGCRVKLKLERIRGGKS